MGGSEGMKPREKVSLGKDQVVFRLAAEREEPGEIVVAAETAAERREAIKRRSENRMWVWSAIFG